MTQMVGSTRARDNLFESLACLQTTVVTVSTVAPARLAAVLATGPALARLITSYTPFASVVTLVIGCHNHVCTNVGHHGSCVRVLPSS